MRVIASGLFMILNLLFYKVEGSCILQIPANNSPLLTQRVGSKEVIIRNNEPIKLDDSDIIKAYCANGFKSFHSYNGEYVTPKSVLEISCSSNRLMLRQILEGESYYAGHNFIPECTESIYGMFESRYKLPNCPLDSSYILGARLSSPIIIAAMCYDLDKLRIKYVSYKEQEWTPILSKYKDFYPAGLNSSSFSQIVKLKEYHFKFPGPMELQQDLGKQIENNFWFEIANYKYDSIIQTKRWDLLGSMQRYENFLNIIWWNNLRSGNWRRFMKLLDARTKSIDYNIFNGISGHLQVPIEKIKCDNESSKELVLSGSAVIPQFVWTYLQSTSLQPAEEFVVIGYNSPYFEYFTLNSTVICNDMCDEISWLQPMQDSRKISAMGRLYCCHIDEVVGLIDGLPYNKANQTFDIATEAMQEI